MYLGPRWHSGPSMVFEDLYVYLRTLQCILVLDCYFRTPLQSRTWLRLRPPTAHGSSTTRVESSNALGSVIVSGSFDGNRGSNCLSEDPRTHFSAEMHIGGLILKSRTRKAVESSSIRWVLNSGASGPNMYLSPRLYFGSPMAIGDLTVHSRIQSCISLPNCMIGGLFLKLRTRIATASSISRRVLNSGTLVHEYVVGSSIALGSPNGNQELKCPVDD